MVIRVWLQSLVDDLVESESPKLKQQIAVLVVQLFLQMQKNAQPAVRNSSEGCLSALIGFVIAYARSCCCVIQADRLNKLECLNASP
jgi:hypothetical protein